jgi:hypothetical protein
MQCDANFRYAPETEEWQGSARCQKETHALQHVDGRSNGLVTHDALTKKKARATRASKAYLPQEVDYFIGLARARTRFFATRYVATLHPQTGR